MNKRENYIVFTLITCLLLACAGNRKSTQTNTDQSQAQSAKPTFQWDKDFKVVDILSSADSTIQKAYFYRSLSRKPQPLFVHLHTWSNNFTKADVLADIVRNLDWNYIHPNFRGENKTPQACCSELVTQDIDDAIDYALQHPNVDNERIYVAGYSGGGMATLCAFMKSRHRIKSFSSWVPISDLESWYAQSLGRKNKYAGDILLVTSSKDSILKVSEARERSPFYMVTPANKLDYAHLKIYAGIHDGYTGSVPITQSLKMYNKILRDVGASEPTHFVPYEDILYMLETRLSPEPETDWGYLYDRKIHYKKSYGNVQLVIFEGSHEMIREALILEIQE